MTLLIGSVVYNRLPRSSIRRAEAEAFLLANKDACFPGLVVLAPHLVKELDGKEELAIDIVVVDPQSRRWWCALVVGMVSDFEDDVLVPLRLVRRSQLLSDEIEAVAALAPLALQEEIRSIVDTEEPTPLVFVSNPQPEWSLRAREEAGRVAVYESFRSSTGETMVRLNGDLPKAVGVQVATCKRIAPATNILRSGDIDAIEDKAVLLIHGDDGTAEWVCRSLPDGFLISPAQLGDRLDPATEHYGLHHLTADRYALRPLNETVGGVQ